MCPSSLENRCIERRDNKYEHPWRWWDWVRGGSKCYPFAWKYQAIVLAKSLVGCHGGSWNSALEFRWCSVEVRNCKIGVGFRFFLCIKVISKFWSRHPKCHFRYPWNGWNGGHFLRFWGTKEGTSDAPINHFYTPNTPLIPTSKRLGNLFWLSEEIFLLFAILMRWFPDFRVWRRRFCQIKTPHPKQILH